MTAFCVDKRNYLDFMIKWAVFITNITLMHFVKRKHNKKPKLMIAIKNRISYTQQTNDQRLPFFIEHLCFLFVYIERFLKRYVTKYDDLQKNHLNMFG